MTADVAGGAAPAPDKRGDVARLVSVAWALDRKRVGLQLALLAIGGLSSGVGLLLLIPIVNSVADTAGSIELPLVGDWNVGSVPLPALLFTFVIVVAIQAFVTRSSSVNSVRLQQEIVDRLRHDAFSAILSARWSFVLGMRRSDIVQVVTEGAGRSGFAMSQLLSAAVGLVFATATAIVALVVAPAVAAIAIVAVVVLGLAQSTGIRPAQRLGHEFNQRSRDLQAVVTDSLDSLRLVRAHDASALWAERLADAFANARQVQVANSARVSTINALSTVGAAAAASLLVLIATWMDMSPPSIVILVVLVARLSGQVQALVRTATQLANSLPAVSDILDLTASAESAREVSVRPDDAPPPLSDDEAVALLEFRDVTFHYSSSGRGVSGLDMTVPRGGITAIAGPSGAGKSTVADLALGLLEPDAGDVLVCGSALETRHLPWWRRQVAYVPQETVLMAGTLRDNLQWSVQHDVTDDDCFAALDRAAAQFARELPDGLDTMLGDRGVRLSGGERQRVAIARALLRRPALLVLDEATSSLDDETEAAVLDTLAGLVPAMTVLVIAHRRSTLDLAQHVVSISAGRAVGPLQDDEAVVSS